MNYIGQRFNAAEYKDYSGDDLYHTVLAEYEKQTDPQNLDARVKANASADNTVYSCTIYNIDALYVVHHILRTLLKVVDRSTYILRIVVEQGDLAEKNGHDYPALLRGLLGGYAKAYNVTENFYITLVKKNGFGESTVQNGIDLPKEADTPRHHVFLIAKDEKFAEDKILRELSRYKIKLTTFGAQVCVNLDAIRYINVGMDMFKYAKLWHKKTRLFLDQTEVDSILSSPVSQVMFDEIAKKFVDLEGWETVHVIYGKTPRPFLVQMATTGIIGTGMNLCIQRTLDFNEPEHYLLENAAYNTTRKGVYLQVDHTYTDVFLSVNEPLFVTTTHWCEEVYTRDKVNILGIEFYTRFTGELKAKAGTNWHAAAGQLKEAILKATMYMRKTGRTASNDPEWKRHFVYFIPEFFAEYKRPSVVDGIFMKQEEMSKIITRYKLYELHYEMLRTRLEGKEESMRDLIRDENWPVGEAPEHRY